MNDINNLTKKIPDDHPDKERILLAALLQKAAELREDAEKLAEEAERAQKDDV